MKHTVENYIDVDLETYDTDLFLSDNLPLYIDNPDYAWPAPASELTKPITRWEAMNLISQMLPPRLDVEIPMLSNRDYNNNTPGAGFISWSKRDAAKPILFGYRGVSYEIDPDNTNMEFIYWDPNFNDQFRYTNDPGVALAPGMWLMCTNKAGIAHPCTPFQLIHAAVLLAGTIRAQHYLELRNNYVFNGGDSLDSAKPFEMPFEIVSELNAIISVKLSFRIMPYRAYSTGATAGGGQTSSEGGSGHFDTSGPADWGLGGDTGGPSPNTTNAVDPGDTYTTDLGSHYHGTVSHDHDLSVPSATGSHTLGSHSHTQSSHDHNLSGSTASADCGGGNHNHSLGYSANVSNETPSISSANLGSHTHGLGYGWNISSAGPNTYSESLGSHKHTMPTHGHSLSNHTHSLGSGANHTHDLDIPNHTHTVANHTHSIVYGIHEESNSPTVHFHIDNGEGFGSPSDNYGADRLDINITSLISGSGWKAVRFDTNLRCRIFAIVTCKLDIDA
ncbi:hypothetical protein ES703_76548 [subsurface metagenome]